MSTPQQHIGSGFLPTNTAEDVARGIDLHGKNIIVTGGSSGLGAEAVRVFVNQGAQVFVPALDVENAKKALSSIGVTTATVEHLDLSKAGSIKSYAQNFLARNIPLHILVNNAAIMGAATVQLNEEGIEAHFAVNHLGHFQLTVLLKPALVKANGARVVTVSALMHRRTPVIFDDINFKNRRYDVLSGYAQSKTANSLFVVELDRRWKQHQIRAFSVHPGISFETNLSKHQDKDFFAKLGAVGADGKLRTAGTKTIEQCSSTTVFAAVSPKLSGLGGVYLEDNEVTLKTTDPNLRPPFGGVEPYAVDPGQAARLWTLSEVLTGVREE